METVRTFEFTAVGDEAVGTGATCFAYVMFKSADVDVIASKIVALKQRHGAATNAEIHGRVLFSGTQRRRSAWRHLDEQGVLSLYAEMAQLIADVSIQVSLSFMMAADRMDLGEGEWIDAAGERTGKMAPAMELGDKSHASLCALAARIPLAAGDRLSTTMFWHDHDSSKTPWFDGKRQASQLYKRGYLEGNDQIAVGDHRDMSPAIAQAIEMADTVAYLAQRVADLGSRNFDEVFDTLVKTRPVRMQLQTNVDGNLVARELR